MCVSVWSAIVSGWVVCEYVECYSEWVVWCVSRWSAKVSGWSAKVSGWCGVRVGGVQK